MGTIPKHKDFKVTSDGVMVADIGFKKQLWALDPELDVVWDWGSSKWEIWRFPGQKGQKKKRMDSKAFHMLTVQTEKRTFRQLGADVLLRLQKGDPTRYSLNQLAAYFDQMDDNIARAKEKKMEDWISSVTCESVDYLRGVVKRAVPFSYKLKPGEEKLLLSSRPRQNVKIFKPRTTLRVASAVREEG